MNDHILGDRRKALEESFFRKMETEKLEKMRKEQKLVDTKKALQAVSGIDDNTLLDKLVELRISPDTFAALSLTPLVEIAWADGKMEKKEREAVLLAADRSGLEKGSPAHQLLDSWLHERPGQDLLATWKEYIRSLTSNLADQEAKGLKLAILAKARSVAESAGGFLGMGSKICAEEQQVLDDLEKAFATPSKS